MTNNRGFSATRVVPSLDAIGSAPSSAPSRFFLTDLLSYTSGSLPGKSRARNGRAGALPAARPLHVEKLSQGPLASHPLARDFPSRREANARPVVPRAPLTASGRPL